MKQKKNVSFLTYQPVGIHTLYFKNANKVFFLVVLGPIVIMNHHEKNTHKPNIYNFQ